MKHAEPHHRNILFVRHGRTDYNDHKLADHRGRALLTHEGHLQAERIARDLGDREICAILSSPLQRCIDTVLPLASSKRLRIEIEPRLREVNTGDFQDREFRCEWIRWSDSKIGGGESILDVFNRVSEALYDIVHAHRRRTGAIVVCSHGDPLVLMRKYLHGFDYTLDKPRFFQRAADVVEERVQVDAQGRLTLFNEPLTAVTGVVRPTAAA